MAGKAPVMVSMREDRTINNLLENIVIDCLTYQVVPAIS